MESPDITLQVIHSFKMSRQLQKTSARLFQNNPRGLKSPAKVIHVHFGGEQFMKSIQKTWMIHGHFGVRIPGTDFHLPVWGDRSRFFFGRH